MTKHQCPEGYIQVTDIKVMQKLLEQLLWKIHCLCEERGLIYNLDSGTLLGAVRHKGFIPWDDDVDISMPRPDYEKLIDILRNEKIDGMTVEAYPDDGCLYPFAKVGMDGTVLYENFLNQKFAKRKLYVDVFPVDGYPKGNHEDEHVAEFKKYQKYVWWVTNKISPSKVWWRKPLVLLKPFVFAYFRWMGLDYWLKEEMEVMQKYSYGDSEYITHYWATPKECVFLKRKFLQRKKYFFEEQEYWGVEDYDAILMQQYGDYMTLPPLEKRTNTHGYELFVRKDLLENFGIS